jgi:hypothetical protein
VGEVIAPENQRIVLVHSPLVGPETVQPLATALEAMGAAALVPDLRPALGERDGSFWGRYVNDATTQRADVVVGHSGAGAYLPLIAERLNVRSVAYVDAIVPEDATGYRAPPDTLAFLDRHTRDDGLLEAWPDWWPAQVMIDVVPERSLREHIIDGAARVPRRIYDESIPLPTGWTHRPAVYLQLSDAYDAHRARAESYRWPTRRAGRGHLDIATAPEVTAAQLEELWQSLDR